MTELIKPKPPLPVDSFNTAIEEIYYCAHTPAHWPVALQAIADHFGDVGGNLAYEKDGGGFVAVVSRGLLPSVQAYNEYWWQHDFRGRRSWDMPYRLPGAVTDRHFVTPEEVETHPFYAEFLASYGLRWAAGIEISPDRYFRVTMVIHRSDKKEPYSDGELAELTRLGRHAEQSLRLGMRLLHAELANVTFSEALARLGIGVFVLDARGHVEFQNPAAARLLGDGFNVVNNRLAAAMSADRPVFEAAVAAMLSEGAEELPDDPRPLLVRRASSERSLAVYILPVRVAPDRVAERMLTRARVMVLVIDPQADEPADPSLVRDLLGVTLGEARVAALVGAGRRPREAAERLGISEETARTALKRVFAKTGMSSQSELAALLTRLVLR